MTFSENHIEFDQPISKMNVQHQYNLPTVTMNSDHIKMIRKTELR